MTTAPSATLGPWERRRLRTSLEIEQTGLELISRHGLHNVTVEQVAAHAGISSRTYFRYFRNVPDILTRVPLRETARTSRLLLARPPGEPLLDAFRAVFEENDAGELEIDDPELRRQTLALWTEIMRQEPDTASAQSHALPIMTSTFEEAIRSRVRVDDVTAGVLASAIAGVIWFSYLRWIEHPGSSSLSAFLSTAFERLAEFNATTRPRSRTRARRNS